jgi:Predicted inhibitor of MCP methylation, homolog of CheC
MELKDSFIKAVADVMPIFKLRPSYQYTKEEQLFIAAEQINVLNSFSHTLQGNIVFGFSKARALKIASNLRGVEVHALDGAAKNAIGDITTLAVNVAISRFKAINSIAISPPTFICGENVLLMISRVKTTKLVFKIDGDSDLLSVAYYVEEGNEAIY